MGLTIRTGTPGSTGLASTSPSIFGTFLLLPVLLTVTLVAAHARAPDSESRIFARIERTLEPLPSAYLPPFLFPCPTGTPTTPGLIPGCGYARASILPFDEEI